MKKRLFRTLLMLCLLLAALTVITLTAMASTAADYSMRFYGNTLPQENPPVTEINMNATFYCQKCKKTTVLTPSSIITLTGIQFPVDNDHHKMALTGSISTVTCSNCNNLIGPINFNVTFTAQNGYFCHNGARYELLEASGSQTIDSGSITFTIGTTPQPLQACSTRPATCGQVGLRKDCYHCEGCDKYFLKSNAQDELSADDIISPTQDHNYDLNTGVCSVCHAQSPAHLGDQFYATFEDALKAYNAGIGGTLTVYSLPENTTIDLERSGTLVINNGAAASKITMSAGLTVTIENAGTINAIKMGESSTLTIENSGTIKAIEMDKSSTVTIKNGSSGKIGSIGMNQPGTLTIENSGKITSIKTSIVKSGDGSRTITVTNSSAGVIDEIEAPNTTLTVQNDGEIKSLIGYFYLDMVKLLRGSGPYTKIVSMKSILNNTQLGVETVNFVTCLNAEDDYFYFPDESNVERKWVRSNYITEERHTLNNVYISGLPITSIDVTGTAGNTSLTLTPDKENRPSMTVQVGQTVALTGSFTVPTQGLKSTEDYINYSWSCKHAGSTTYGSGKSYTLTKIQYGTYELTLTLTDSQYNYSKSLTFYLYAKQPEGQKTKIRIKGFNRDDLSKPYDGTTDKRANQHVVFCDADGNEIPVEPGCYNEHIVYRDKNCISDNELIATVTLTPEGEKVYELLGNGTYTAPAEIRQADPYFTLKQTGSGGAHVGDSIFQCLEIKAEHPVYKDGGWSYPLIFGPVTPGKDIVVDGESVSISLYRVHPSNLGDTWLGQIKDFVHDPAMNEELTESSTFTAAGKYYVYAVMEPTRNFMRKITGCLVIDVQDTEASAAHHVGYAPWDGTGTVPITAKESKSFYLSGSRSTIYTELLLGLEKNLTLCLNGKTLSATNGVTSYNHIRVTDSAALAIDDCVGTGTVKGAAANGGWGGIAYVKNGMLTIKHGKFTGGTASTGGGAIVVEAGGTLIIEGGEISGNTVTSGNGGAIYIKDGGTVTITDGKITDNHVTNGNGGAIYVEKGGTLNLYGGTITGNTASGLGGGIYVEAGGTLKIQGKPVVTGNTANGQTSNVYVRVDSTSPLLTISGAMTSGAELGISTDASYPALLALTQQDHSAYFTPDAPDTFVVFSGSALTLCAKPSATLEGSTLTVKTGGNYMDNTVLLFVAEYSADGRLLTAQSQAVKLGTPDYTFKVSSSKIKCFLLNAQTYTPLMEAFVFN